MKSLPSAGRHALLSLRRGKQFAFAVCSILALGLGAASIMVSAFNGYVIKRLPFYQADKIVFLGENRGHRRSQMVDYPTFLSWREQNTVFDSLVAHAYDKAHLTLDGTSEVVETEKVSAGFFRSLGIPVLGREFLPPEDSAAGERVSILGYEKWLALGRDRNVIGRTIIIDGLPHRIVGVLQSPFRLWRRTDLFLPIGEREAEMTCCGAVYGIGRLRNGITRDQAAAQMNTIEQRLKRPSAGGQAQYSVAVRDLREVMYHWQIPIVQVVLVLAALVLVVACANACTLVLSKFCSRSRDIAVRFALGASVRQIIEQLTAESVLVALLGGALGLALAWIGCRALSSVLPTADILPIPGITPDWRVMVSGIGLSLVVGIVISVFPVLHVGKLSVSEILNESGAAVTQPRHHRRAVKLLVTVQVSAAVLLLATASLLIRTAWQLSSVHLGANLSTVLTMRLWYLKQKYPDWESQYGLGRALDQALRAVPGVTGVAMGGDLPLDAPGVERFLLGRETGRSEAVTTVVHYVSDEYFQVLGLNILRGRSFARGDPADGTIALINESMARKFWGIKNALGSSLEYATTDEDQSHSTSRRATVVGIVEDTRTQLDVLTPTPQVYLLKPEPQVLVIRVAGEPLRVAEGVRNAARSVDRDLAIYDARTLPSRISDESANPRVAAILLSVFAVVALVLATSAVTAIASSSIGARKRELGIRMAMGATPARLFWLILRQEMAAPLVGVAVGAVGTWAGNRILTYTLIGFRTSDHLGLSLSLGLLLAIIVSTLVLLIRPAVTVSPMKYLREG